MRPSARGTHDTTSAIHRVLATARLRAAAQATELIASLALDSPFLRGLDSDQLRALSLCSRVVQRDRGALLFAAGDAAPSAFLVVEGAIIVERAVTGAMTRVKPGRVICTSTSATWGANARAERDARALEIPRTTYNELKNTGVYLRGREAKQANCHRTARARHVEQPR